MEFTPNRDRFFDGATALRHQAVPQLDGRVLLIADAEGNALAQWPLAEMTVLDQNAVNGSIVFGLATDPRPRLVLFEGAQREALLRAEPRLRSWKRRRRTRGISIGLAWAAFGVALAALLYFGWRDGSIWIANMVPRQWERNLGDRVRLAVLKGLYECDAPQGKQALEALGKKLLPPEIADLPLTIDVVRVKDVNAFALPGNHIFVFSGLIDRAQSPDELAGVLAHEMGHLELRHPTRGMVQQLGLSAVVSLMFGGNAAGDIAFLATAMSYTRDMEREADGRAIALLRRAELRTDGLASFFRHLEADKSLDSPLPDWLSSHPGLEERAKAADESGQSGVGNPALSPAEWQSVRGICGGG